MILKFGEGMGMPPGTPVRAIPLTYPNSCPLSKRELLDVIKNLSGALRKATQLIFIFFSIIWIGGLIKIYEWKTATHHIPSFQLSIFLFVSFLAILSYFAAFKTNDTALINIYISTGATLVFIFFAEITVRIFTKTKLVEQFSRPAHLQDDFSSTLNPMWGGMKTVKPNYMGKTHGHPAQINSYGFRGKNFALLKNQNTFRIIVLGDSLTFGQGVSEQALYTSTLQNLLQNKYPDRKIEVINLGICGYSAVDEATLFEHIISKINFDLVLIGFSANDVKEGPQAPNRWRWEMPLPHPVKRVIAAHMVLARLLQERYDRLLMNMGIRDTFISSVGPCYNKESKAWKKFLAAYQKIFTLTTKLKRPKPIVGLLLQNFDKTMLSYLDQVEKASNEMGFVTVNYLKDFKKLGKSPKPVSKWEGHPDEFTHSVYAQGFYDTIVKLKIIQDVIEPTHSKNYHPDPGDFWFVRNMRNSRVL